MGWWKKFKAWLTPEKSYEFPKVGCLRIYGGRAQMLFRWEFTGSEVKEGWVDLLKYHTNNTRGECAFCGKKGTLSDFQYKLPQVPNLKGCGKAN